jgi:hypothetical protein
MARAAAVSRRRKPSAPAQRRHRLTAAETQRREEARLRALHAVALMRRGRSFTQAADAAGTSRATVKKYARQAVRKRSGQYEAIPIDELRRPMRFLTERGIVVIDVRSSKTASRLATYWNAVDQYLRTGDVTPLAPFAGKRFRADGSLMPFVTDPYLLDRLANAGQVTFEDLYEATA